MPRAWFDMSLISRLGRQRADELKLLNRRTYQELIFEARACTFNGEAYVLPRPGAHRTARRRAWHRWPARSGR